MKRLMEPLYPVGYLCLTPTFCVAAYGEKPHAVHLWMLRLWFGITWQNAK